MLRGRQMTLAGENPPHQSPRKPSGQVIEEDVVHRVGADKDDIRRILHIMVKVR